jgi:hypothetical protein
MKFEIQMLQQKMLNWPVERPPIAGRDLAPERKAIRLATDHMIHDALLRNDLPATVEAVCKVMIEAADVCIQCGDPEVDDFVTASRELTVFARDVVDRGLRMKDMADVKAGVVMLEIVLRGFGVLISMPYLECYTAALNNEPIEPILRAAGVMRSDDANEPKTA